jgi:hypothetical protein
VSREEAIIAVRLAQFPDLIQPFDVRVFAVHKHFVRWNWLTSPSKQDPEDSAAIPPVIMSSFKQFGVHWDCASAMCKLGQHGSFLWNGLLRS